VTGKKTSAKRATTSRTTRQAPKSRSAGQAAKKEAKAAKKPSPKPEATTPEGEDAGLTDQVGSVVSKLLELTETGFDLGTNFLSLLNSLAQSQLHEPVHPGEGAYRVVPPQGSPEGVAAAAGPPPGPEPEPGAEAAAVGSAPSYCIINRLPLLPGSPVQVSFSINNDLPQTKRKLHVAVGGFVGAARGFDLDDRSFAVQPSEKTISPMDFEKFVLKGKIPKDAPEDTYNGWVTVDGDEEMRIPVVLVVTAPA
jgi:hypothetical protein